MQPGCLRAVSKGQEALGPGSGRSPAPTTRVKASPHPTRVALTAWSPSTRYGARLARQEMGPSWPCWLLPTV